MRAFTFRSGATGGAGQAQPDHGSATWPVAGRRDPAVRGHDGPDDGQAQAGPAVTTGSPGVRAAETLERVRQEAGGETGPVVADLDVEVPAVRLGGEHDDRAAGSEPHRVVDQVV